MCGDPWCDSFTHTLRKAIQHAKQTAAELGQLVTAEQQLHNLNLNKTFFGILQFRKREDAIPLLLNHVREVMRLRWRV